MRVLIVSLLIVLSMTILNTEDGQYQVYEAGGQTYVNKA